MTRTIALWLVLLLSIVALNARAADMALVQTASATRAYSVPPNSKCYFLCHDVGTTSGVTCGPGTLPLLGTKKYGALTVAFGNVPSACTPGSFAIDWCATTGCSAPAVTQTIVTLTGVGDGEVSGQTLQKMPPANTYQARFSAIGDSDCDSAGVGQIDVIVCVEEIE